MQGKPCTGPVQDCSVGSIWQSGICSRLVWLSFFYKDSLWTGPNKVGGLVQRVLIGLEDSLNGPNRPETDLRQNNSRKY